MNLTAVVLTLVALAVLALGWRSMPRRRADTRTASRGRQGPTPAAWAALAGVPVLALGVYLTLGFDGGTRTAAAPGGAPPGWADAGDARAHPLPADRADRGRATGATTPADATLAATAAALAETTAARRQTAAAAPGGPDIEALLQRLSDRLRTHPDDVDGWLMLARSNAGLDRHAEAARAYAEAARRRPDDAQLLADWADALAMAQGRSARGEPGRLIERALALDPANVKARVMAAAAAVERGDPAQARQHFEAARAAVPADGDLARTLDRQIAALRP